MRTRIFVLATTLVLGAGCGSDHERVSGRPPTSATFRSAVNAVLPAVVYIQVESHAAPALPLGTTQGPADPGTGLIPEVPQGPSPRGPAVPAPEVPPAEPSRGAGSGVIFRSDGYILTSDHVVRDADQVLVTLHDHRQFTARVVAEDPSTDVAVVKIDGSGFPAAALGNSDELEPGDWVLALGSPLGLQFSVTAGVVSALGRSIGVLQANATEPLRAAPLEHFIQTDAAINPGNSGGPLVDLTGRVIGINTAIATPTGVYAGAGFAVPINLARRTAEQLIHFGEVRRAFLGAVLSDVSPADARVFRLPAAEGSTLTHIDPQGPAAAAGLQMGDVVVRVDTVRVQTTSDLQNALASQEPGGTADVTVIRYGERLTVPVRLGLLRTGTVPPPSPADTIDRIGIGFAVVQAGDHLLVGAVRPYSAADRANVRPGQVIQLVNRRPVHTVDDLARIIASGDDVLSLVVMDPQVGQMIINYSLRP